MKTKKLTLLGLLSALSLILFVIELRLPALIPVPGVKPAVPYSSSTAAPSAISRVSHATVASLSVMLYTRCPLSIQRARRSSSTVTVPLPTASRAG